ncbi:23S rRNA (guanosine(2251)-2'-O)-methyltransferase RlmB [candidate division KSB1 bacterium]|nr:23S rRNA (guanosine(2251)-2'-O)-methyltransferase RlmB [candidate division KSB1 bacterium]
MKKRGKGDRRGQAADRRPQAGERKPETGERKKAPLYSRTESAKANLIWGRQPVWEWLDSGLAVQQLILARDARGKIVDDIVRLAEKRQIRVKRFHPAQLDQMAGTEKHQNIIAEVELPSCAALENIYDVARKRDEPPLLCLLDGVQDPHNLGAIVRSADAAGVHGLIIARDRAAGITPTVLKSSAGAAAWVPVAAVTNLSQTIDELKEKGLWLTGATDDAPQSYEDADFSGPTAIVLGSEGAGMRRIVREKCDFLVRIPMHGRLASLNVSVAAGLLFFEARRQRGSR